MPNRLATAAPAVSNGHHDDRGSIERVADDPWAPLWERDTAARTEVAMLTVTAGDAPMG